MVRESAFKTSAGFTHGHKLWLFLSVSKKDQVFGQRYAEQARKETEIRLMAIKTSFPNDRHLLRTRYKWFLVSLSTQRCSAPMS